MSDLVNIEGGSGPYVVSLEAFMDQADADITPSSTDEQIALTVDVMMESNWEEGWGHSFTADEAIAALSELREQRHNEAFIQWLADCMRGTPPTPYLPHTCASGVVPVA